jgi:hypothetical protein
MRFYFNIRDHFAIHDELGREFASIEKLRINAEKQRRPAIELRTQSNAPCMAACTTTLGV